MKRICTWALAVVLLLSLTACAGQQGADTSDNGGAGQNISGNSSGQNENGNVDVEQDLFDVELTIPAEFLDEGITQEDLDAQAEQSGFLSATLNDDGSVTYVMTHAQHDTLMGQIRESLEQSLDEMLDPETYPSFQEITANDDYTEFTVKVTTEDLGMNEAFSVVAFYMFGGLYNAFNGTSVDDIAVSFVNADTGEVIETAHSSEMGE